VLTPELFERLYVEDREKLVRAGDRDVHDDSKTTTLPIAGEIVGAYVRADLKTPWYIDLLNINIDNVDLPTARERIRRYLGALSTDGTRITENLDFA
jgi:malate synthase